LFDKLCLLCEGKVCYFGNIEEVSTYLDTIGYSIPANTNPAEYLLDLVNADFDGGSARVAAIQQAWVERSSSSSRFGHTGHAAGEAASEYVVHSNRSALDRAMVIIPLLRRLFTKSYRDVLAYGVRYAMYTGLAIMMGTVWLRLKTEQAYIQAFINAIVSLPPVCAMSRRGEWLRHSPWGFRPMI